VRALTGFSLRLIDRQKQQLPTTQAEHIVIRISSFFVYFSLPANINNPYYDNTTNTIHQGKHSIHHLNFMDCNGAFTFAEKEKDDGQQSYFMHLCRLYGTIAIGSSVQC
jgi:hypothetical protein